MEIRTVSAKLIDATSKISSILQQIKDINSITKLIAINAAIESSRSAQLADSFSTLSDQVRTLSTRSEDSFTEINSLIEKLRNSCAKAISVRLGDIAVDVIDKIDRNLFERNCDIQAWATYKSVIDACKSDNPDSRKKATKQINHLVNVYEVYHDILLLDKEGKVICSAKRPGLVGQDQSKRIWFRKTVSGNSIFVTDLYFSKSVNAITVSYSMPVKDEKGKIIGVISSRFNWDYVFDILEKVKLDQQCKITLISSEGLIIGSKQKFDVLKDNVLWLGAGELCITGKRGYSFECARNGQWKAFGFARTRGYNSYPGKGWSIIVDEPVNLDNPRVMIETFPENHKHNSHSENRTRPQSEEVNNELLQITHHLGESIDSINRINNITTTLALNAAIRADRAGTEGRAFSVLAEEIRAFSSRSDQLTEEINGTLDSLNHIVQETVSTRLADASFDTIDKVDRNLFERNCDIQAWAAFDEIIHTAETGKDAEKANLLLKELHQIYEVYHDIYILNTRGQILSAAVRQELIGQDHSARDWFQQASQGQVYVSDLYKSETTGNHYTLAFSAPIKNSEGKIVGVLSSRLNWAYIQDIINVAMVYSDCKIYLLNSDGLVIASTVPSDIFKRDFSKYEAYRLASMGNNGFIEERDPENNSIYLIGYSLTEGYNKYKGKGWIVLVLQSKGV
ncbi:MAG: hypothetical protein KDK54_17960 [Leptospiraceae bacterium]|nr:hypothetical protein [Leptospiraceae bacterium]